MNNQNDIISNDNDVSSLKLRTTTLEEKANHDDYYFKYWATRPGYVVHIISCNTQCIWYISIQTIYDIVYCIVFYSHNSVQNKIQNFNTGTILFEIYKNNYGNEIMVMC